jgi:hypothetical protein
MAEPHADGQISRRTLVAGAAGIGALAALAPGLLAAGPARADVPVTRDGVVALARSYLGQGLQTIRSSTSGGWASYPNADWCAWFATWCLRGVTGGAYYTYVTQMYQLGYQVSTPDVGDVVIFPDYHVGIVSKYAGGSWYLVDGNGGTTGALHTVVQERVIWNSHTFIHINYPTDGAPPPPTPPATTQDLEEDVLYIRNSARGDFIVSPGVCKHVSNPSVGNVLQATNPAFQIYTVVDGNINAVLEAFSGVPAGAIPSNGGIWVNPAVGNFPVDYGTSSPAVSTVLHSMDSKLDTILAS